MQPKPDINELFEQFTKLKVMIIGDMMLDSYIYGNVDRISPEAPVPVVHVKKENRPGGAANVAMNIKSMGATPLLLSVIGDDAEGKLLMDLLDEHTIALSYIIKDAARITTTKTRVISMHNQMLRMDNEVQDEVSHAISQQILVSAAEIIEKENPDILIFEDYNKGVLTEKLIREITMLCLQKNIPVAVDPKKKNFFAYQLCTLFKPNIREIQESLHIHIDPKNVETINLAAVALHKKLHHGISLITLSDCGIYLHSNKDILQKPAHVRNVSDVSGAGDTVISVAALCLAAKTSLETIAALANIAGGIVCEYNGVVPIDRERLRAEAMELL